MPRDFLASDGPPRPLASGSFWLPKPMRRSRLTGGLRSRRLGCTPPRDSWSSSSSSVSSSSSISWSSWWVTWSLLDHLETTGFLLEPLEEPRPAVEPESSSSLLRGVSSVGRGSWGFLSLAGLRSLSLGASEAWDWFEGWPRDWLAELEDSASEERPAPVLPAASLVRSESSPGASRRRSSEGEAGGASPVRGSGSGSSSGSASGSSGVEACGSASRTARVSGVAGSPLARAASAGPGVPSRKTQARSPRLTRAMPCASPPARQRRASSWGRTLRARARTVSASSRAARAKGESRSASRNSRAVSSRSSSPSSRSSSARASRSATGRNWTRSTSTAR